MRDYAFLEAAKDEVLDATDWFIERNPSVAIEFLDAVRARVDQAMEFPGAGAREAGGCRSLQVGKYSFRMIYRVKGQTLEVLALAHTSREPGYWKDRL